MLGQISYDNNGWHSSHKPLLICRDDKKMDDEAHIIRKDSHDVQMFTEVAYNT